MEDRTEYTSFLGCFMEFIQRYNHVKSEGFPPQEAFFDLVVTRPKVATYWALSHVQNFLLLQFLDREF
jgi:hypothetical protein